MDRLVWFQRCSVGSITTKEGADAVALTIMNTNTGSLAGAIIAGIIMYVRYKKFDITMILNGALGGLVAITAGPDLYNIYQPILIGVIGGALVVFAVPIFDKMKIDDPVGALSVHLVNGIWGTLAVGIFAADPENGITLMGQIKGIVVVGVFAFTSSLIVIYLINRFVKFRASDDDQIKGLDIQECGLEAYPEHQRFL